MGTSQDTKGRMIKRQHKAILFLAFLLVLFNAITTVIHISPLSTYFSLMPIYGAWHGINPYATATSGAIWGWIYGPFNLLTYAPLVFFKNPNAMIRFATIEGLCAILGLLWFNMKCFGSSSMPNATNQTYWHILFWLIASALVFSSSLMGPVSFRSMDLTAIVASSLGLFAMDRKRVDIAILLLAIAAFSKQTHALLSLVPLLTVLKESGWRKMLSLLLKQVCIFLTLALIAHLIFGPAIWLNLLTIPSRQHWETSIEKSLIPWPSHVNLNILPDVLVELAKTNFAVVSTFILAVAGHKYLTSTHKMWFLAIFLALVAGTLGRVKVGGGTNNYSLLACLLICFSTRSWPMLFLRETSLRSKVCAVLTFLVVLGAVSRKTLWLSASFKVQPNPIQTAVDFLRENPDSDLYFNTFPIAHFLAKGEIVHWIPEFQFRQYSGMPPSKAHWQAHLPANARWTATVRDSKRLSPGCYSAETFLKKASLSAFEVCPLTYEKSFFGLY